MGHIQSLTTANRSLLRINNPSTFDEVVEILLVSPPYSHPNAYVPTLNCCSTEECFEIIFHKTYHINSEYYTPNRLTLLGVP